MVSVLPETVTAAACLWVRLPGIFPAGILVRVARFREVQNARGYPGIDLALAQAAVRHRLERAPAAPVGSQDRPVCRASTADMGRRNVPVPYQRSVLQLKRVADFRIPVNLAVRDVVVYVFAGLRTPRSEARRTPERKVNAGIRVGLARRIRGRLPSVYLGFPSIIGASARQE